MRLFRKKPYDQGKNWRFHSALRMCQAGGIRMGTASRIDGVWVYYVVDGKMWRFKCGRVVGPLQLDTTLWKSFRVDGAEFRAQRSGMRFTKLNTYMRSMVATEQSCQG
jgi:hypothetical protein